jgi:hypothetical protein
MRGLLVSHTSVTWNENARIFEIQKLFRKFYHRSTVIIAFELVKMLKLLYFIELLRKFSIIFYPVLNSAEK